MGEGSCKRMFAGGRSKYVSKWRQQRTATKPERDCKHPPYFIGYTYRLDKAGFAISQTTGQGIFCKRRSAGIHTGKEDGAAQSYTQISAVKKGNGVV